MDELSRDRPSGDVTLKIVTSDAMLRDHRSRWKRGDSIGVEAYLELHPAWKVDTERILELIYNEGVLREEAGESPQLDEYVPRFPDHADPLAARFHLHPAHAP